MKNLFVYSLLILSVAACLCSADDTEGKDETGKIAKTLEGIGKAADKGASVIGKAADKGASVIGKAADKGAAAISKATDKTAAKVDEIRNQEPHEHGQGKLIPSFYSGASKLAGTVTDEIKNVAKAIFSGARNTGKAVGQTAKYSAMRLLPARFRNSNIESSKEE